MKIARTVFIFCVTCIIATACSAQPATSYVVTGNLEGITDGTKIELIPGATYKDEKPVAEATVTNGKFEFTGVENEPRMFYIRIAGSRGLAKVMIENGEIELLGKVQRTEQGDNVAYDFDNITVKGSKSHALYLQKRAPRNTLDSLYKAYHDTNKEISDAISKAKQNKNKVLVDSLNKTDAAKRFADDEKHFFDTVEKTIKGIVIDNKETWWGPLLMLDVMSYFTAEQNSWYQEFSQEAKDSYYGRIVKAELFPEGFVGKPLPAFVLVGKAGKETTVSELSVGKKYILIDFWASWCAPCRKEIPNLKKLYSTYSSKGFEIISISIDKKEADWEKALKEEKLAWPNYLDSKGANDVLNVKTIPAMFLIDDKGMVIAEKIRGKELEDKLAELFK